MAESREVVTRGKAGGPSVFITRKVPNEGVAILEKNYQVKMWNSEDLIPRDILLKEASGAKAIFCTIADNINKEVLDAAGSNLKIVATMSVGMHHIDAGECSKRSIQVANTPDVCSDAAAELTVALLLLVTRRLAEGIQAVKDGEWGLWKPMWICGIEMVKRTVGIMGFGRVGFGVARRIKPFGVSRIIYYDVTQSTRAALVGAEFVDMNKLLTEADVICICCALTPNTEKLFNASAFAKMKNNSVLINTSRAGIVDTDALLQALKSGKLMGAGLDVTDPEPLPPTHPLMSLPNCLILPHLGTNAIEARVNMSINTARNIAAVLG